MKAMLPGASEYGKWTGKERKQSKGAVSSKFLQRGLDGVP